MESRYKLVQYLRRWGKYTISIWGNEKYVFRNPSSTPVKKYLFNYPLGKIKLTLENRLYVLMVADKTTYFIVFLTENLTSRYVNKQYARTLSFFPARSRNLIIARYFTEAIFLSFREEGRIIH